MNVLIICNGQAPPKILFEQTLQWSDICIAADGGGNIANLLGHPPDIVIGDMDSYQPRDDEPYEVIHDPDQYSNDLEKALKLAKVKGATHVKVLGATGQRLDHTLKNISVLKQFDAQFEQLIFLDAQGTTSLLPKQFSQEMHLGTTVSLFPLSGRVTGITLKGLKYPLTNEIMENGVRDGSSNTVVENTVIINHKKGDLLLFIPH